VLRRPIETTRITGEVAHITPLCGQDRLSTRRSALQTNAGLLVFGAVGLKPEKGFPVQAVALMGTMRRRGLVPGMRNRMCQKSVSGEINSTPTYCLPSRAWRIAATRHSIDSAVWSLTRISLSPTSTVCPSWNRPPCWLIDSELASALNLSWPFVRP